ncbi:MAG: hypothetical protein ACQEUZ_09755 [Pseudomonadota bacterium]
MLPETGLDEARSLATPAAAMLALIAAAGAAGARAALRDTWRRAAVLGGLCALLAAFAGPLPVLAEELVSARMAQLALVAGLAAKLLARAFALRRLSPPLIPSAILFAVAAWAWAAPAPGATVSLLAGPALLGAGLLLWASLRGAGGRAPGTGAGAALAVAGWLVMLGAMLVDAAGPRADAGAPLTPAADAALAAALLAGLGAAILALPGARLMREWLRQVDRVGI